MLWDRVLRDELFFRAGRFGGRKTAFLGVFSAVFGGSYCGDIVDNFVSCWYSCMLRYFRKGANSLGWSTEYRVTTW